MSDCRTEVGESSRRRSTRLDCCQALSGYGAEADLAQSSAVGFSVQLTEPVDIDRLDQEIQLLGE
jgi:hypothetical protein